MKHSLTNKATAAGNGRRLPPRKPKAHSTRRMPEELEALRLQREKITRAFYAALANFDGKMNQSSVRDTTAGAQKKGVGSTGREPLAPFHRDSSLFVRATLKLNKDKRTKYMPKATNHFISTKELCKKLKIHRHTLEKMVKDGLPIAGRKKTRGRGSWMFDSDDFARWAIANGRNIPALAGEQIKSAMTEPDTAPPTPQPSAVDDTEPIALQLQAERSQYQKLFSRFLRTHANDDASGIAALSKSITLKSDALRRLELSVVEYRKHAGELVELGIVTKTFYELASGTRERVMALPNILAPILRNFLRDSDDAGRVRDLIDKEVRHALTVLPQRFPEVDNAK